MMRRRHACFLVAAGFDTALRAVLKTSPGLAIHSAIADPIIPRCPNTFVE